MTGTLDKIKDKLHIGHGSHSEASTDAHHSHDAATGGPVVAGEHATETRRKSSVSGAPGERKGSVAEGVGRQLFNPNADKFSELSYGPVGSHSAVETLPASVGADEYLYTDPAKAKKEHGVLRQIFNPHGDKYDETRFGTTASVEPPTLAKADEDALYSTPMANKDHSVLRQILNPGGDRYDPVMHGGHTASNDPAAVDDNMAPINDDAGRWGSTAGLTGRHGSIAEGYDRKGSVTYGHRPSNAGFTGGAVGGGPGPARAGLSHHQHNQFGTPDYHSEPAAAAASGTVRHESLAPEAAIGAGAVGAGVASHHAGHGPLSHHVHNNEHDTASPMTAGAPVAGTGASAGLPAAPASDGQLLGEPAGVASVAGTTTERSFPLAGGASSTLADRSVGPSTAHGDHHREGLAAAAGAATVASAAAVSHEHSGHGHEYRGASIDPDVPTGGPHATRTGNLLDPSLDRAGPGSGPVASAYAAEPGTAQPGTASSAATGDHRHGKDAALVGGAGVGALGAYEAAKHASSTETGPAANTLGPHDKDWKNIVDPRVQPEPSLMKSSGPDASGPASNTIGPHDKDWKNIVDPRVQPEPALMKQPATATDTGPASKTIGPHSKNWMNILDPRVKPQPELMKGNQTAPEVTGVAHPTDGQARAAGLATAGAGAATAAAGTGSASSTSTEHHHGKDAALVGGAGAAGIAAEKAWKQHEHQPVVGERGLGATDANPYSSHAVDPRVDGSRAAVGAVGPDAGSSTSTHHYGRDAAIAAAAIGAGGMGAHELGSHHGERVGGEALGAHDPSTHHGTSTGGSTGASGPAAQQATLDHPSAFEQAKQDQSPVAGATSIVQAHSTDEPSHPTRVERFDSSERLDRDPLFQPGVDVPAPGSQAAHPSAQEAKYHGESRPDEKLDAAREDEADRAHDEASGAKKSGILGFLGLGGSSKDKHADEHDEDASAPHLHKDRNRLHKDPPAGHPAAEGTTIGTGSGITAATIGKTDDEDVTRTGRQM